MIKTAVMKLLTVKAAAVIALTAAGGVAVAATTGTLPTTLTGSEHNASGLSTAASHRADKPSGKPSAKPSASDKGKEHDGDQDGKGSDGANGSPSPSLVGLCHAVSSGNKDEHGKALENPAFTALITAAGGNDKVDAFCAALLASASAAPKEHPSQAADGASESSDHRTGPPTDHRTGKPSAPAHS